MFRRMFAIFRKKITQRSLYKYKVASRNLHAVPVPLCYNLPEDGEHLPKHVGEIMDIDT